MDKINDGGSAFPRFPVMMKNPDGTITKQEPGMTLRDYFAAKAMQSMCVNQNTWGISNSAIARACYSMADAMLRAREET